MRKGQPQTEEAKQKISMRMRGRPKSEDTKEKMAFARVMWWSKKRHKQRILNDLMAPIEQEGQEEDGCPNDD